MDIVYIILLSIFSLTFLGLFIYQFCKNKADKIQNLKEKEEYQKKLNQTEEENEELGTKVNRLADEVRNYYGLLVDAQESYNNLASVKHQVEQELIQLQSSLQVEAVKSDSKEAIEAELENLKALAVEKMSELQQITANTQKLAASQNEKLEEITKLEAGIKALEGRISSGKVLLENLEDEIVSTNNHLQLLVTLKANVLAVESGEGSVWEFRIPSDKSRLVELIHQLVDEYGNAFPILRKELLKAEWSSVWLPQVQQLCSREGLDKSGIYRLRLKSNPDCVYIGQAQSIKDRWYTHIKKMLGVEAKGSERLYEYGPDDFEWSVVEFKEGNLDSDEKYWIDYYKCREIGLNKKG